MPDHLGHRFAIERVQDRLADAHVLEERQPVVDPHPRRRRELFPALGRDRRTGQLRETHDVEVFGSAPGQDVDLARFERGGARRRVGNDVPVDVVDLRQARLVIVLVLHQVDERGALPFLELEGPGANRCACHRLGEVSLAQQVLRRDRQRAHIEQLEKRSIGSAELELHRVGIERAHAFHRLHGNADARIERAHQLVGGEHHVVRREGLAVVPRHPLLQLEGVDQAVLADAPLRRQAGLGLQLLIEAQQAVVDVADDHLRWAGGPRADQ